MLSTPLKLDFGSKPDEGSMFQAMLRFVLGGGNDRGVGARGVGVSPPGVRSQGGLSVGRARGAAREVRVQVRSGAGSRVRVGPMRGHEAKGAEPAASGSSTVAALRCQKRR